MTDHNKAFRLDGKIALVRPGTFTRFLLPT